MSASIAKNSSPVISTKLSDHPRGLAILFFAELWERFSFYGMRAMLVLYMTSQLLFHDSNAYAIYAIYGVLVYTTGIAGGFLADKILGSRRAVFLGGIIIACGHFCMALPPVQMFYLGLGFIIVGTGLFKSNVSALVGQLYEEGDPRRDAGFTLFYVGINVGGFLAPLFCGYIGEVYGWHYGFGIAGIGMLLGLATLLRGDKLLEDKGLPPQPRKLTRNVFAGITLNQLIIFACFAIVPLMSVLVFKNELLEGILPYLGASVLFFMLYLAFTSVVEERNALLTLMVLMFFHTCFFAMFEQAGSSLNLFAERNVNRYISLLSMEVPTSWFQSVNPAFIMLFGPIISSLWTYLGAKGRDLYPSTKFVLGLGLASLGFMSLVVGINFASETAKVDQVWLILGYFLMTVGELCIVPIGLSLVTKLAPPRMTSLMMGIWFLTVAFGHFLAGLIAKRASVSTEVGEVINTKNALLIYQGVFQDIAYFGVIAAFALLILAPFIRPVFAKMNSVK